MNFNLIPEGVRTPGSYVEFDSTNATPSNVQPHRILILGQRLNTGTIGQATAVQLYSGAEAETYFGQGSMLALMARALKSVNRTTECWALGLDDPSGGAKAAGQLTVTLEGQFSSGNIYLYVAGVRLVIAVEAGMSEGTLTQRLVDAVNAAAVNLPVSATFDDGEGYVAIITANHKGLLGNEIDLQVNYNPGESLPDGVTVTVTALSGGSGAPDVATAIAAFGEQQYNTIVMPWTDNNNLSALEEELERRWGPMVALEGQAVATIRGSLSTMATLGNARNSPHLSLMGSGLSITSTWIWSAVLGGVEAGETDPARPRQDLQLKGLRPPRVSERLNREDRDTLLHTGVATYTVGAGGQIYIERLITTYQSNASGTPDTSFLDIESLRTLAFLRWSFRNRMSKSFYRFKLANDGQKIAPGQAITTPRLIRAEAISLAQEWEGLGLIEDLDAFAAELVVERNANDPSRVDALLPPNLVNQFRILAASISFKL